MSEFENQVPVIDLSAAPGRRQMWDQPLWKIILWQVCENLFITSAWQPSSALRVAVLRAFGAQIGKGAVLRPRLRVKFPWKLSVGDRTWIGENVWIHNQDQLRIGSDAVVSQGTFITTGSHDARVDMALVTKPVEICDGAWVTARCTILGGVRIGRSALIHPGTVVGIDVPDGKRFRSPAGEVVGDRFT